MLEKNKIFIFISIADSRCVVAQVLYLYTSYFLESCTIDFKKYEYSNNLFYRIGEKLGDDLFFNSKRVGVSLTSNIHIFNGYCLDFIPNSLVIFTKNPYGKPINGSQMESFDIGFRRGLEKGFPTACIDLSGSLLLASKKFAENQPN